MFSGDWFINHNHIYKKLPYENALIVRIGGPHKIGMGGVSLQ